MTTDLPPLAVYAHLPWCVAKCPYCDFNSHVRPPVLPEASYVQALLEDAAEDAPGLAGREVVAVFLGGGTPSLFSPQAIGRLLEGLRGTLAHAQNAEVTMEANPGTLERARFSDYRDAGVTRVSLGAQSFDDGRLQALGRIHRADETRRAAAELHAAGLANFNLDLMYALPEQTVEQAQADLQSALALEPAHISHYQLTLEPGTAFFHRPPALPDAEQSWAMQLSCLELLGRAGFEQYEVSAHARPGRQCRHNLNYWQFGDYLGLGAGAHGKQTVAAGPEIWRTVRCPKPREYLAASAARDRVVERRKVAHRDLPFEFMLNALRLREGFEEQLFESRTGLDIGVIGHTLSRGQALGLLERDRAARRWRPTALGFRFLNDLQALFLPEQP